MFTGLKVICLDRVSEQVCRVRVPRSSLYDSLHSDEEEDRPDWVGGRAGRETVTEQGYHSEPAVHPGLSKVSAASGGRLYGQSDTRAGFMCMGLSIFCLLRW